MNKFYKRFLILIVLVLVISGTVIYTTVDINTLKNLTQFKTWSIALAIFAVSLGLFFDGSRLMHLVKISDEKITLNMEENSATEEFDEDVLHMRQLLKTKLSDQDLSVRALNCLKAAEVETVGDLVRFNRNDLLKFRNFGKKSLSELDDLLATLNLHFGMDVSIYKLDKD